ncbi:TIGR03089 family protein [Solwaraspora sp. WMMB335]|uniref:TIGR03089 family protein n=1 Tax=Solwaraspora sp. WMMB335 TaxID=3404118 RepID=UPI003B95A642
MTNNIAGLLAVAVAADPTRPLLTFYDDATGDRTELSGATLANWVAKTANLLVDEAGTAPGDAVEVRLPPHWQTAAVLLGCWSAGLVVGVDPAAEVLFATGDTATDGSKTDGSATGGSSDAGAHPAGQRYLLTLAPMAAPARTLPNGWSDYITEVRGHGDHFTPYPAVDPQDADLAGRAVEQGARLGFATGSRILLDADRYPDPVDWLLAPLAADASVVLCRNLDRRLLDKRTRSERVDQALI